jgi:hypothetical protein
MIKTTISYSHVFLPLITESSNSRQWVHQEIGYAVALNIPVLPVAFGELPHEMISELHALLLDRKIPDNEEELKTIFSREIFDALIAKFQKSSNGLFQCAGTHEERSQLLAEYADEVCSLRTYSPSSTFGLIRQKGGLSSFDIPDRIVTDPIWAERYGHVGRSRFQATFLRNERIALAHHAEQAGCRLIVSDGKYIEAELEPIGRPRSLIARRSRLATLKAFLESMPPKKVKIVINEDLDPDQNVTIVGDWFSAESVSRSKTEGFHQTMFTRHAPTILNRIQQFDEEFTSMRDTIPEEQTRDIALGKIDMWIGQIDGELAQLPESERNLPVIGNIPNDG